MYASDLSDALTMLSIGVADLGNKLCSKAKGNQNQMKDKPVAEPKPHKPKGTPPGAKRGRYMTVKHKKILAEALAKRPHRGRPSHEPTQRTRNMVRMLTIGGWYQRDIAACLSISRETFHKVYAEDIARGKADTDAIVVSTAIQQAIGASRDPNGAPNWRDAVPSATQFYLKHRVEGFGPKVQQVKHSGSIGSFDPSKLSDAELDRVTSQLEHILSGGDGADAGEGGEGESPDGEGEP